MAAGPHLKVVAHLSDGTLIKGYTDALPAIDLEVLLRRDVILMPPEMTVRIAGSGEIATIPLQSLKALFFVKTFEGRTDYKEIKFFEGHPSIEGMWVRVRFHDGETIEGIVRNSLHYLVDPGFLLKPPDPHSNNQILYVMKNSLGDFQVLGVRHTY
jgi:hypothetical protein